MLKGTVEYHIGPVLEYLVDQKERMKKMGRARCMGVIAVISLVLSLLFGCGTARLYDGPCLSREKVAILEETHISYVPIFWSEGIEIRTVDKTTISVFRSKVEVLPGWHVVVADFIEGKFPAVRGFHIEGGFLAEAGHTYKVCGRIRIPDSWVWIQDMSTLAVVGGSKPPD